MTDKSEHFVIGFLLGTLLASAIYIGGVIPTIWNSWKKNAIDAGVGRYNAESGEFEFISIKSASGAN